MDCYEDCNGDFEQMSLLFDNRNANQVKCKYMSLKRGERQEHEKKKGIAKEEVKE